MIYIRVDLNNNIIKGFSDVLETPVEGDICIDESNTRHFYIGEEINPTICTREGIWIYKYVDNTIIKKTDEEIAAETPVPVIVPDPTQEKISSLIKSMDFILLELMSTV